VGRRWAGGGPAGDRAGPRSGPGPDRVDQGVPDLLAEVVSSGVGSGRTSPVDQPGPLADQAWITVRPSEWSGPTSQYTDPLPGGSSAGDAAPIKDEDLIPMLREWIAEEGSAPSRERVRTRYGIGSRRADRIRTAATTRSAASAGRSLMFTMPAIHACFGRVDPRGTRPARPVRSASFSCVRSSPRAWEETALGRSSRGTRASPDRRGGPVSVSPEICSGEKSSRNFSVTASYNRLFVSSFRVVGRNVSVSYRFVRRTLGSCPGRRSG